MKKRVYELAKDLDMSTNDLLQVIEDAGLEKKPISGLNDDEIKKIKTELNSKTGNVPQISQGSDKIERNEEKGKVKPTNFNGKETDATQKITVTINKNQDGDIHAKKVSIEQIGKEGETEKIIEESHKKENGEKIVNKKLIIKKDGTEKPEIIQKPLKEQKSEQSDEKKFEQKTEKNSERKIEQNFEHKNQKTEKKDDKPKYEKREQSFKKDFGNKKSFDNKKEKKFDQNRPKDGNFKDKYKNQGSGFQNNKNKSNANKDDKDGSFKKNDKPRNFVRKDKDEDKGKNFQSKKRDVKKDEVEEILPEKPRRNYKQNARKKDNYHSREEIENESFKKKNEQKKEKLKPEAKQEKKDEIKIIKIDDEILVKDFAEKLKVSPSKVIQKLIILGVMASQNETIDFDVAQLIGEEFNAIIEHKEEEVEGEINIEEEFKLDFEDKEEDLQMRWPIVTVMGHVDHGKTSLLDAIKSSNVTGGEAGGITQKIGAYMVNVGSKKICFIDTPGHEAFTAMRARGAQVTDIAILVVAADDGVMPQTIEAINHAKAAGVPIIVAINKIDKPEANVDRIKQELVEQGLVPEEWGGDVIMVPVSAKKHVGIEELLEMVLLVAEMQNLKANPNRTIVGTIIEAELDKHQGAKATVLISKGSLKVGDMVVSGSAYGKVRSMIDDKGKNIKKAGPSTPVVIYGLSSVPNAGDSIYSTMNDKQAKNAAQMVNNIEKAEMNKANKKVSLDDLFEQIKLGEVKDLNIIIKADGKGSIEALKASLSKMQTAEVKANVIHEGVGGITESDVMLASASNAIIVGFNVRPNANAIENAKHEDVDIRTYRIIYDVIEDIKSAIIGMHSPKIVEEVIGHAEIRSVFSLPNGQKVAGIYVKSGKVLRSAKVRLIRDDVVITEKEISSLKRFKDDAKEVQTGFEAGLGIENYNDIKVGDQIEVFMDKEVEVKDLDI